MAEICVWHGSCIVIGMPRRAIRRTRQGVKTVTIKTSFFAAIAALMVSSITVGAAIAPAQAQAVSLPVRTLVNA
jgi:hypothetical protein